MGMVMGAELTMNIPEQVYNPVHIPHRPHTNAEQAIVTEIHNALEANRLDLPTLPDMALKIQDLIGDPNVSVDKIASLLSSDPAISIHIIRTANSAALSNGIRVGNLRDAISRLGYRMLRSMVMNITMTKLFLARSPFVNQQLKELLEHSREVAAISYVLAQQQKHLKPEEAMLAGLVHDIGALPLYLYADRQHSRLNQTTLEELIRKFSASIGIKLLQNWNFPDELVDIIANHGNLQRISNSNLADYADVVTMANLQMPSTVKFVAWRSVLAAERLGYYTADCQNFLSNHADRLASVKGMLEINTARC